ncbi:putative ABC transporter ATP-binding protein YfmR [Porphyridium purpureum]|uniref:Probable ATP-dependent transporter ycf16 n=1 Tax=Porphyridium purpureum TaxID=35688 RepID=A0A5J4YH10_PORPP|nr:putative ABC transporter ATP-binding protein YfmR [Porphyridium purpureum]|eukprot:POR8903..scf270_19
MGNGGAAFAGAAHARMHTDARIRRHVRASEFRGWNGPSGRRTHAARVALPRGRMSAGPARGLRMKFSASSSDTSASETATDSSGPLLIEATGLSKSYDGERVQLDNVSFQIARGAKVGVVGQNGCGKSTLLRILAGTESPDAGSFWTRKGTAVAIVGQEEQFDPSLTISELLFRANTESVRALREYETIARKLERAAQSSAIDDPSAEHADEMARLTTQLERCTVKMDALNAWDLEAFARQVLSRLGIVDMERKVGSLSGGERKRIALAAALIERPELLILDEPTNHLDIDRITWLEEYLQNPALSVVVVTHDRQFLDSVCTSIYELDYGSLYTHPGSYEAFLENKDARMDAQEKLAQDARVRLRKELEWMRRQPKARQAKSKSRIENFYNLQKQEAAGARGRADLQLSVQVSRMGTMVLNMEDVCLSFGQKKILDHFSYEFQKGDRVGVVGRSGIGKSAFLRVLAQLQKPDSGVVTIGETIKFGYYEQGGIEIPDEKDQRVIEWVTEVMQRAGNADMSAIQLLERFQFDKAQWYTFIDRLSGGEKRRLQLMKVLAEKPNFLVLDEPSNDLDLQTLETLEDFLSEFDGVLVVVSHDRIFMDRLTNHIFVFQGDGVVRDFTGTFTDYLLLVREEEKLQNKLSFGAGLGAGQGAQRVAAEEKSGSKQAKTAQKTVKTKLSYNERREYGKIQGEIDKLQETHARVNEQLLEPSLRYTELAELSEELARVEALIDAKTERWMELAELAGD